MLNFQNDYSESAHESILRKFLEINMEKGMPYGDDRFGVSAKEKIRKACNCPDAQIFFLTGGTQTNVIALDSILRPYEGVIAATSGHINTHEAGAPEYTGHKVLALDHVEGKLSAAQVRKYLETYYEDECREHMVRPGAVYITHPTEYGTLYTKQELSDLHDVCSEYKIPLYLDGARLAYGLAATGTDVTLPDIAALTDVFYIGGTKCGALLGEALVFTKNNMPEHYLSIVKQHCALLAKGWVLSLQFDMLFTDDLYFKVGRNAIDCADRLRKALRERGYTLYQENPTNQVFVLLDEKQRAYLNSKFILDYTEKYDDEHTVLRFCTSWATKPEDIDTVIENL